MALPESYWKHLERAKEELEDVDEALSILRSSKIEEQTDIVATVHTVIQTSAIAAQTHIMMAREIREESNQ